MHSTALLFERPPTPAEPLVPVNGPVFQYGAAGAVVLNNVGNTIIHEAPEAPGVSLRAAGEAYAGYLLKTCDRVWGPRTGGQRQKAIRSVYARMFATEPAARLQEDEQEDEAARGAKAGRTGILSIVAGHPRVALLGTPGGGKTTFLRHLAVFRALCHSWEAGGGPEAVVRELARLDPEEANAWRELNAFVPVWIELRSLRPAKRRDAAEPRDDLPWVFRAHLDALREQALAEPGSGRVSAATAATVAATWDMIVEQLLLAFGQGRVLFLLDGLDEATRADGAARRNLRQGIRQLIQWVPPGGLGPASNRVVVTCRERTWFDHWAVPGWTGDLGGHVSTLGAFSAEDRRTFLQTWFPGDPAQADSIAGHLEDPRFDVGGRLSRMASVPLNLTMIAWLVEQRKERNRSEAAPGNPRLHLPPSRAAIYEQVVDAILWEIDDRKEFRDLDEWTLSELIGSDPGARMRFVACLARIAFDKLRTEGEPVWSGEELLSSIADCLAESAGEPEAKRLYRAKAEQVLSTMQCRSGILRLEKEGDDEASEYRFVHRSFLEYFVALHLVGYEGPHGASVLEKVQQWLDGRGQLGALSAKIPGGAWLVRTLGGKRSTEAAHRQRELSWEPLRLAAGFSAVEEGDRPSAYAAGGRGLIPGHERRDPGWVRQVASWLLARPRGTPHETWLAGELAVEAGLTGDGAPAGLPDALVRVMQAETLSEPERAAVGRVLGRLGDPRPGVAPTLSGLNKTPFFAWSRPIPKGAEFILGGDRHAWNSGQRRGSSVSRAVPIEYRISRYPVTNAQYDLFENSPYFLANAASRGWKRRDRSDPLFTGANQPVVEVDGRCAQGFCEWVNSLGLTPAQLGVECGDRRGRWEVRLPTEEEWEYAARGPEGRWLPWLRRSDRSSAAPKPSEKAIRGRCNGSGSGIGCTSTVGLYAQGESWCGALDLIGNVWEWTGSPWVPAPPENDVSPDSTREDSGGRVLRGGSWINDLPESLRCTTRTGNVPGISNAYVGFRVVCVRVSASGG